MNNYRVIDRESYYRKGVFRHFSEDCKCSTSMTSRVDVTELAAYGRSEINKLGGLYAFSRELVNGDTIFDFDPTKISVHTRDIGLAAGNALLMRAVIRSDIMDAIEDAGAEVASAEAMAYRVVDTDD